MKAITLLFTFVVFGATAQYGSGKPFIDFGPKFMVGPSMFKSSVVADDQDNYNHSLKSFRWDVGFKFAFDINDYIALVGEVMYGGNSQVYGLAVPNTADYKKITERHLEFPLMLRYNNSSAGYMEAGYVIGKILNVSENDGTTLVDRSEFYNSNRNGLVFGLGGWLWGNKTLGISGGFRFRYDLDDALATVPADRFDGSSIYALDSDITGKVNPWSITLGFEINYDLGLIMAKSPCTGRRKVFISQ